MEANTSPRYRIVVRGKLNIYGANQGGSAQCAMETAERTEAAYIDSAAGLGEVYSLNGKVPCTLQLVLPSASQC